MTTEREFTDTIVANVSARVGGFVGFVAGWLSKLPDLFLTLGHTHTVTNVALVGLLIKKGLITPEEFEEAKDHARAGLLIEETVGGVGQLLEAHFATFRPGALQALLKGATPDPSSSTTPAPHE